MKTQQFSVLCVAVACLLMHSCFTASADAQTTERDLHQQMIRLAQQHVNAYHQGAERSAKQVRVVYFHASDRQPLPNWRQRLERTVKDVEDFYNDGLRETGAKDARVEFERDASGLVFHLVRGQGKSEEYNHGSGGKVKREIQVALEDKFDLSKEFVLAIHGLCDKDENGKYHFHAPYYGGGSQRNGFCHAADCELLDPKNLSVTDKTIVYGEHYYKEKKQTYGLFNSWYIGGIAHELGHGLSLPHDAAAPRYQSKRPGFSLMGSGNHHYREDLWGGQSPSYLSIGSCLRLLSHPIVTASDRDRFRKPIAKLGDIVFGDKDASLQVSGSIESDVPAYAMIGYLWFTREWPGNRKMDHLSYSYPIVLNDDSFKIDVGRHPRGQYRLRLCLLHTNGAQSTFEYRARFDRHRNPDLEEMNGFLVLNRALQAVLDGSEDAKELLDSALTKQPLDQETKLKLDVLSEVLDPPEPVDLTATDAKRLSLSDAKWESANVGWGELTRNHYDLKQSQRSGAFLSINGKFFNKGLYAHSNSRFVFETKKRWKTFEATVGLQDGATQQGSAVFRVIGDGELLYQSKILRANQSDTLKLDISSVSKLEITARGGEGHNHNSWALWAAPMVIR